MLEIKKHGNSGNRKIFGTYIFELVCIMVLYIGSMVFALCWFSQPFDEKLELITVTTTTTTETTTNTTTTTTTEHIEPEPKGASRYNLKLMLALYP